MEELKNEIIEINEKIIELKIEISKLSNEDIDE
jgi:hypothetical protein